MTVEMAVQVNGQLSDFVSSVACFGEACKITCITESRKIVEFRICYKLHLRYPMKKHSQVSNWSNNWFYKFKAQCMLMKTCTSKKYLSTNEHNVIKRISNER